jgi:hypothetical protein
MQQHMSDQGALYENLPLINKQMQTLEAAQPALLDDIMALHEALLKGSRLTPRDCETLTTHFRKTRTLLTAAVQTYEEMILSLTTPLSYPPAAEPQNAGGSSDGLEQRRVPRRSFGGVAEISTASTDAHILGLVSELSRYGCFVRTHLSVPIGAKITLKITHHAKECVTRGEVVHAVMQRGIGIKFEPVTRVDEALLEDWLRETMA